MLSLNIALLIARLLLALTLAVAGMSKLADRPASRQAVVDFGVPKFLAIPLGILLPLAELGVAAALMPAASAWWGALGALALLSLFVLGISTNLARGRKPDCHCFGQLHSAPAGWKTLARNGALAAIAGFVLWQGYDSAGPGALGWIGNLPAAQLAGLFAGLVLFVGLVGQWWFLVHLLHQNGRLLMRIEALEAGHAAHASIPSPNDVPTHQPPSGLPIGTEAPHFSLSGLYGETLTLDALRALGKPVMLLFADPNCDPCTALLPDIGRWQKEHPEKLTISLISRGTPEENRTESTKHSLSNVLLQIDWEVFESYQLRVTPSAVLVRPDGTIGHPVAGGPEAIGDLVTQAVETPARVPLPPEAPAPPPVHKGNGGCPKCGKAYANGNGALQAIPERPEVGEPAPKVKLKDLSGKERDLRVDFEGEDTLVLFWNPGCGFCQQMLPNLKEWEEKPPERAPTLLLISAGTEDANKAMGLRSPVVIDQGFAVGRSFGVSGTPSAVLVDAEGKIASGVAAGAPAVLELAGVSPEEA